MQDNFHFVPRKLTNEILNCREYRYTDGLYSLVSHLEKLMFSRQNEYEKDILYFSCCLDEIVLLAKTNYLYFKWKRENEKQR